jgi:hypothetical protein
MGQKTVLFLTQGHAYGKSASVVKGSRGTCFWLTVNPESLYGHSIVQHLLGRKRKKISCSKHGFSFALDTCSMSMCILLLLLNNVHPTSFLTSSLLTDPKSRKVIVVEQPLLPLHIKEALARILFNNLQVTWRITLSLQSSFNSSQQVPSISFASSHVLALLAAGRVTGLVLDCGHLESVALPVSLFRTFYDINFM